ncbi:MAG: hypothetical protein IJO09_05335 [Oscillospiraceae bacterium]|nr:hypothetical protein [Oscillospiraceae bacterium]
MFDETNKTEETENALPETLFGSENETSADTYKEESSEVNEAEKNEAGEKAHEVPRENHEAIEASAARAREQIARISESVGLSGAWGNLFRAYPDLPRSKAAEELYDAVKGGLTPLEAYQKKLLSEREHEIRAMRKNEETSKRSVGSLGSDAGDVSKDDFLEGFFIED